jgi:hypothetical protein
VKEAMHAWLGTQLKGFMFSRRHIEACGSLV